MKKKITDENGKVYVEKKPFYKKGCFWILKHRIKKMTELFRKMRN